jgi:endonuclease YncB( thermonuclease family)
VDIDGRQVQVKYAGIDAPPLLSGRTAEAAWQYNTALVAGQIVVLVKDGSDADENGSLLRYVFVGDRFANYELVRMGYASRVDSPELVCANVLREAEEAARAASLGLWAPTPIPTATYMPTVAFDPGSQAACDCSIRWECSDFATHDQAQACFNACNDYNSRLDEDYDGLACEELP